MALSSPLSCHLCTFVYSNITVTFLNVFFSDFNYSFQMKRLITSSKLPRLHRSSAMMTCADLYLPQPDSHRHRMWQWKSALSRIFLLLNFDNGLDRIPWKKLMSEGFILNVIIRCCRRSSYLVHSAISTSYIRYEILHFILRLFNRTTSFIHLYVFTMWV